MSLARDLAADAARSRTLQRSRFGYAPVAWWLDPGFVAVLLHRLAHRTRSGKAARALAQANSALTGFDGAPAASIGPGWLLPQPCGATFSGTACGGLTLLALAGAGGSLSRGDVGGGTGVPLIGAGVTIGPLAGVLGAVRVGDGATIAAGAGAIRDVPPGAASVSACAMRFVGELPPLAASAERPTCPHASWRATWRDWHADLARYAAEEARYSGRVPGRRQRVSAALTPAGLLLLVQRIAHWLHCRNWARAARALAAGNLFVWKATVPARTCLGGGIHLPHLAGLVVDAAIGERATFYVGAIACGWDGADGRGPVAGDALALAGHAAAIGPVTLAPATRLAPKAHLLTDANGDLFSPSARFRLAEHVAYPPRCRGEPPFPVVPLRGVWAADLARWREHRARGGSGPTGIVAVALHRLAHAAYRRGDRRVSRAAWLASAYLTGCDLSPASEIGPGLLLPHPAGVAFHGRAGADLTLMVQTVVGAALGDDALPSLDAAPRLGAGVRLDHHALVWGACRLGDDARVLPGGRVVADLAAGQVVAPPPLRRRRPVVTVPRR